MISPGYTGHIGAPFGKSCICCNNSATFATTVVAADVAPRRTDLRQFALQDRAFTCARCGATTNRVARRLPEGRICCSCYAKDPLARRRCSNCRRMRRPTWRLANGGVLCQGCAPRPQHTCSRCGKTRPAQCITGHGPICNRCYVRTKLSWVCALCGAVRIRQRNTVVGPHVCLTCRRTRLRHAPPVAGEPSRPPDTPRGRRPRTRAACAFCGRVRTVHNRSRIDLSSTGLTPAVVVTPPSYASPQNCPPRCCRTCSRLISPLRHVGRSTRKAIGTAMSLNAGFRRIRLARSNERDTSAAPGLHREFLTRRDVPITESPRITRSTGPATTPCSSTTRHPRMLSHGPYKLPVIGSL